MAATVTGIIGYFLRSSSVESNTVFTMYLFKNMFEEYKRRIKRKEKAVQGRTVLLWKTKEDGVYGQSRNKIGNNAKERFGETFHVIPLSRHPI